MSTRINVPKKAEYIARIGGVAKDGREVCLSLYQSYISQRGTVRYLEIDLEGEEIRTYTYSGRNLRNAENDMNIMKKEVIL